MAKKYENKNPLGKKPSAEEYTADLYDLPEGAIPPSGKVVARQQPLKKIVPDRAQPRRLVPAAVRAGWDGTPAGIAAMLKRWHEYAEERLGETFSARDIIRAEGEALPKNLNDDKVVDNYLETVQLAGNIYKDGQLNPITVYEDGDWFVLETGERRLMATHLLNMHLRDGPDTVLTVVTDENSVWRQAAENNARVDLTAIGKARQLALLIMAMYEEADGVQFKSFEALVKPGKPDQRFYAQVADGVKWRTKRGYGDRIQEAMGLTSRSMLNHYRNLLRIPAALWVRADEEDWPEYAIRQYDNLLDALPDYLAEQALDEAWDSDYLQQMANVYLADDEPAADDDMSTTVDITPDDEGNASTPDKGVSSGSTEREAPIQTIGGWRADDPVYVDGYGNGTITEVLASRLVRVRLDLDGGEMEVAHDLLLHPKREPSGPAVRPGDCVRMGAGHLGIVIGTDDGLEVVTQFGKSSQKRESIKLVEEFTTVPKFNAMLAEMDFPGDKVNAIREALGIWEPEPEPDTQGTEGTRVYVTRERQHGTVIEDTGGPTVVVEMRDGRKLRLHRTTVHKVPEDEPEAETDVVEMAESVLAEGRALDRLDDEQLAKSIERTLMAVQSLVTVFRRAAITEDEQSRADEVEETVRLIRQATWDELEDVADLREQLEQVSLFLSASHDLMQDALLDTAYTFAPKDGEGKG